jgi:NHLM bacteriocin system ABC transporter peptidase/ATP-binding protein
MSEGVPRRVRTPTVLQMEAVECGAAALGIILAYHGRYIPLEELRVRCGVSRDGSKAVSILKAARALDMQAEGWKLEVDDLKRRRPPFIVFWKFSHFLVVEGFGKGVVYLNDPASGPRRVTEQDFGESYTGVALMLEPGPGFEPGGKPPTLLGALRPRLASSRAGLTFVILAGIALMVPALISPVYTQLFVDRFLVQGASEWVTPLLVVMVLTAALIGFLTWLQQTYLLRLQVKLSVTTSSRFLWHVLRLPVQFFSQRYAGEIGSRVALNDLVATLLSGQLATTVITILTLVFYLVMMALYSVPLTLVGVVVAALNLVALRVVSRRRIDANRRLLQDFGKLTGTTMAGLQMIETVKASGMEDSFFARFGGHQAAVVDATQSLGVKTQFLTAVPVFLTQFNALIMLTWGAWLIIDGSLTVGMLAAFMALAAAFVAPFAMLVTLGATVQEAHGDMNRLDDVLKAPLDSVLEPAEANASAAGPKLDGHLEVRGLTFGYSPLDEPLIRDFHLTVRPGRRVALVGGSGSGKTTIANLVCGLYEPWEGAILFDGKTREEVPRDVMVSSVSRVSQDIHLFEGSGMDNLTMWDATLPEERVLRAAEDACVRSVLAGRRDGLAGEVAEGGANFSGGERQRLEIARALAVDPRIVILDEATSALDPVTEERIDRALRRRGCTCLIIAHRLSTIRDCDEIVVLDRGVVVERGTHEDLVALEGVYAGLVRE